ESPAGLIWDSENYSCAYDASFSILCDIWIQDPKKWTKWFYWLSKPLEMLAYNYREVLRGRKTLKMARDNVRKVLYKTNHALFPYGQVGTNIAEVARQLMVGPESPCYAKLHCDTCNKIEPSDAPENIMHITSSSLKSTNCWFQNWQEEPA
ncbi:hypothetical protein L208DRAFT_1075675, partial [Tricholoma matsutake]